MFCSWRQLATSQVEGTLGQHSVCYCWLSPHVPHQHLSYCTSLWLLNRKWGLKCSSGCYWVHPAAPFSVVWVWWGFGIGAGRNKKGSLRCTDADSYLTKFCHWSWVLCAPLIYSLLHKSMWFWLPWLPLGRNRVGVCRWAVGAWVLDKLTVWGGD